MNINTVKINIVKISTVNIARIGPIYPGGCVWWGEGVSPVESGPLKVGAIPLQMPFTEPAIVAGDAWIVGCRACRGHPGHRDGGCRPKKEPPRRAEPVSRALQRGLEVSGSPDAGPATGIRCVGGMGCWGGTHAPDLFLNFKTAGSDVPRFKPLPGSLPLCYHEIRKGSIQLTER